MCLLTSNNGFLFVCVFSTRSTLCLCVYMYRRMHANMHVSIRTCPSLFCVCFVIPFFALFLCFFYLIFFLVSRIVHYICDCPCMCARHGLFSMKPEKAAVEFVALFASEV